MAGLSTEDDQVPSPKPSKLPSAPRAVTWKGHQMTILATSRTSALARGVALAAIAGAMVSIMATNSWAQKRSHRNAAPAMASEPIRGDQPVPNYIRPPGQCVQDEGQGRFTPCDGGGDAGG